MMEDKNLGKSLESDQKSGIETTAPQNCKSSEQGVSHGIIFQKPKYVRLKNWQSGNVFYDTLYQQAHKPTPCSESRCLGSVMFPKELVHKPEAPTQSKEQLLHRATHFLEQYYTTMKRAGTPAHSQRLMELQREIDMTGTYQLTPNELIFGAKLAWRNAARCVGRIQWSRLQLFDAQDCNTVEEMFTYICNHIKYSTNKGNIRSAITIFPQRSDGNRDFRIWNSQYIRYAGFTQEDGTIMGDGASVEFTELCLQLGWKPKRSRFTVLPLVLQANGETPQLFEIPPELILEVPIQHPHYEWFSELNLKWYALPAVANMLLEIGGLEFPAAPFNGWYTGSEIGVRNYCDSTRYNLLQEVAERMGLERSKITSLWKDKAAVELTVAVLHSFQLMKVTIVDHHTITESFMKHLENEHRLRGGCPTDWVWIVPPISGSLTPAFHQEFLNYNLSPAFHYQTDPWKTHVWKESDGFLLKKRPIGFKELATAVTFSTKLMSRVMAKRIKVTILYATETGKSETFARKLCEIFKKAFDPKVMCMDEYDIINLQHETLVLTVTSTFGNGDPPENGQHFADHLMEMANPNSSFEQASYKARFNSLSEDDFEAYIGAVTEDNSLESTGPLASVRFAVFGLGSRVYPHFCAFARAIDTKLEELGAQRILTMAEGDELCGQDDLFRLWSKNAFKAACEVFCIDDETGNDHDDFHNDTTWKPNNYRLSVVAEMLELEPALSHLHKRKVVQARVLSRQNLQHKGSGRSTILVCLHTGDSDKLKYIPGDHVGVHPANQEELVQRVMARLVELPALNDTISVERLLETRTENGIQHKWVSDMRLPNCTVAQALTYFLDITSPASPELLQYLAQLATDRREKEQLEDLGQGTRKYEEWKWENVPTVADVLDEFPSVRAPASLLLTQLPLLQPRYYSISSSPDTHPFQIHLTVAVVKYHIKNDQGPERHGVCSSWLNCIEIGDSVPCFIRRAPLFHLPSDSSTPCLLVGPGTGIAPYRSFWQQRLYEIENQAGLKQCEMSLIFGCRYSQMDHLYKEEMMEAKNKGVFKEIYTAYSRDPDRKKEYVQDIIRNQLPNELFQILSSSKGHLYVCGDVTMAQDVSKTVQEIIATVGMMSLNDAASYLTKLKDENRYHEDIFGLTLRTREVATKIRSTSLNYWQETK
ncbi:nitric oxide synthase, brain-like isoform X1 [Chiloscyllium plagiosum]|uniref:nitric oxide synthase, brain-like isoform X1 n=1 Tax=Chiloscyllium plagiosum TaxID=36176 RepID=UPI001CB80162|nr:nitric oxide synthase, brain-like isoform X1 [Chiloscyllium plagiosum]